MYDKLTRSDIEKMEQEIEYRKLVVRKEALEPDLTEISVKTSSTMQQKKIRTEMRAGSGIWSE